MEITRDVALELLQEYTKSDALRKHGLAVEAVMRAYAKYYGEDEEKWGICGLLHDFDYEKYPTEEEHPSKGSEILKEKGYPKDIITAILGHGNHTGVARETLMAKTLFAVDELSGFVVAVALVRPDNFNGLKPKSVKKKLKDKGFAAKVNRQDIEQGIEELGVDKDEHIQKVIDALQNISAELGFND